MSVALAHSYSSAEHVPSSSCAEPVSSLRLVSPPQPSTEIASSDLSPGVLLDFPRFEADALFGTPRGDVLQLRLPGQPTPDEKGWLRPHVVFAYLHGADTLELELHSVLRRGLSYLDTGVWAVGDYVHWQHERALDFSVLDAVDLALRRQLPPSGGVLMFQGTIFLASGSGVGFSA